MWQINYKYNNGAEFYGSFKTLYKTTYEEPKYISNEIIRLKYFSHKNIQKILLTDDSRLNRTLLARVLKEIKNFEILEATNGPETIDIYNNHKDIDLIFMDFHMPHMTGKEVIDKLHNLGYKNNIILYKTLSLCLKCFIGAKK